MDMDQHLEKSKLNKYYLFYDKKSCVWETTQPLESVDNSMNINVIQANWYYLNQLVGTGGICFAVEKKCKTEPPCESHSIKPILAQRFEKLLTLYLVCQYLKQKH